MVLEQRREPTTVRLPNPSAQPFVAALKTARFYAVLFFWVAMVCVAAHATVFVLAEWVGLYDAPRAAPASGAPAVLPQEPTEPDRPAEPAAPAAAPSGTSWLMLLENTALAARSEPAGPEPAKPEPPKASAKEPSFFGVPAGKPGAPPETPREPPPEVAPAAPTPSEAPTEGKIVGRPEAPPAKEPVPLTPEQRRQRADYYHRLTANILRPARIVGILVSLLLGMTLFLYLQIALLGRLAGIRQLTNALFVLLLFLATILPWESIFEGFNVSALWGFEQLLDARASRLRIGAGDAYDQVVYFGRFFGMPLASMVLLAWSGIQFAAGYSESVLANE